LNAITAVPDDPAWHALSLDNLTLTRKEDFAAFAEAHEVPAPPALAMAGIKALDPQALEHHNEARRKVALKDGRGRLLRVTVKELLFSDRAAIVPEKPGASSGDLVTR
jgi:hypothetical protein